MLAVNFRELNASQRITSRGKQPFALVVRNKFGKLTPTLITSESDYLDNFTSNGKPVGRDDLEGLALAGSRDFYCWRPRGNGDLFGGVDIPVQGTELTAQVFTGPNSYSVVAEAIAVGDGTTALFTKTLNGLITSHVAAPADSSVKVYLNRNGTKYLIAKDDGLGAITAVTSLADIECTGTVINATGVITLNFSATSGNVVPVAGESITVNYDDENQDVYTATASADIVPESVSIKDGATEVATDDGQGVISGTNIRGTIIDKTIEVIFNVSASGTVTYDFTPSNPVAGLTTGLVNVEDYDFGSDHTDTIATADGIVKVFLYNLPVKLFEGTVVIKNDGVQVGTDDGFGVIDGPGLTGDIDYASGGALNITFDVAPLDTNVITVEARKPDVTKMILAVAKDPNVNNKDVAIKVQPSTNPVDPSVFDLVVGIAKGTSFTQKAAYTVSFDPTVKDGFNNTLFIEDVVANDKYADFKINPNLPVNLLPSYTTDWVALAGGRDWDSVTPAQVMTAWQLIKNKYKTYPVRMLIDISANPVIGKEVFDIAQTNWFQRAIMTIPSVKMNNPNSVEDPSIHLTRAKAYRDASGNKLGINSVYGHATLYDNWIKVSDSYNGGTKWVSGLGEIARLAAFAEDNKNLWQSVAGPNYGVINNAIETEFIFSDDTVEALPVDHQINVIAITDAGKIIWGDWNLTTVESNVSTTGVRDILSKIEEGIINYVFYKTYEYNDEDTRLQVKTSIEDLLEPLKNKGAFWDYKVICNETNNPDTVINARKLAVRVSVEPRKSSTSIDFDLVHYLKGGIELYEI